MATSNEEPVLNVQRSRSELRSDALQAIREAIEPMAEAGREPDRWECFCLIHAFSAFRAGTYAMAEVEADLARTPMAQRSLSEVTLDDPVFRVSLAQLQRGLRLAEVESLQESDSFWW